MQLFYMYMKNIIFDPKNIRNISSDFKYMQVRPIFKWSSLLNNRTVLHCETLNNCLQMDSWEKKSVAGHW